MRDTQSRKYLITINNPLEHEYTRESIREKITSLKSLVYFCAAEERGLETGTHHIHIYIVFSSGVRFSTIKKVFSLGGEIEPARGSSAENRNYVSKSGKWADDKKSDTRIDGTFEEWGEMPEEHPGISNEYTMVIDRILDGASNAEILREFPQYLRGLRDVEYVRQTLRAEEYRDRWRDLETVYIWGTTGAGKTRYVMESFGYGSVYAVNDYKYPFDGYAGESVILFDEFASNFRIQDMNNYLDGYPLALPARYSNKQACYDRVFIVSNLDLRDQYTFVRINQPEVWAAFIRRIHRVTRFFPDGSRREYETHEYLASTNAWKELPADAVTPFDNEPQSMDERGKTDE